MPPGHPRPARPGRREGRGRPPGRPPGPLPVRPPRGHRPRADCHQRSPSGHALAGGNAHGPGVPRTRPARTIRACGIKTSGSSATGPTPPAAFAGHLLARTGPAGAPGGSRGAAVGAVALHHRRRHRGRHQLSPMRCGPWPGAGRLAGTAACRACGRPCGAYLAAAVPDLHLAFIAGTRQLLAARLLRRHGLRRRPPAHIEVIVMTTSQRPRRTGSPVRRILRRSARALRNLHDEQLYAWECFFRPAGAPRPRTQAPAAASDSHATAGSRTPAPAWPAATRPPDTSQRAPGPAGPVTALTPRPGHQPRPGHRAAATKGPPDDTHRNRGPRARSA